MKRESCNNCGRPISVCLCKNIIKQTNKTQIVILQHPDEVGHYLNTAIMAKLNFNNSTIETQMTPRIKNQIKQAKFPAILYPEIPNKKSLTSEEFIKVDLLIVLDGTWRKAKRLLTIDPILETLPYLSLNIEKPKLYTLRKSQKSFQYSTLESVTYALEAIEKKSFSKALYVLEKQMSLQKSFNSQKKK